MLLEVLCSLHFVVVRFAEKSFCEELFFLPEKVKINAPEKVMPFSLFSHKNTVTQL